jgi:hypothetical protein
MRIFVNSIPWSLKNELRAYRVDPQYLFTVNICIPKEEVKYFKGGLGVWGIYTMRLKQMAKGYIDNSDYEYIGCLGQQDKWKYEFRSYFRDRRAARLIELPIPDKKTLKKLGLT